MAKRRRSRRFKGLPHEHARMADDAYDLAYSTINGAERLAKEGDCQSASKELLNAYQALGRGATHVAHSGDKPDYDKAQKAQRHLRSGAEYIFSICLRSRR